MFNNVSSELICTEQDLQKLHKKLHIKNIDISKLIIKIIETRKLRKKTIYEEGADSSCFDFCKIDDSHFIIYNISGTKAIEYLYIHGVWKIIC